VSLGILADLEGSLEDAADYFSQAREQFRQLGDGRHTAMCYVNQAYALKRLGRYDEAVTAYQQGLFLYRELGLAAEQATVHESLGDVYCALRNMDAALEDYGAALELLGSTGDPVRLAGCHRGIGEVLYERGELENARVNLE
jgi:tetratricopeptide (TPR) repeat protein